jgi:putative membrane protein
LRHVWASGEFLKVTCLNNAPLPNLEVVTKSSLTGAQSPARNQGRRGIMLYRYIASSFPCEDALLSNPEEKRNMFRVLIHWLLSAIALMIVTNLIPGFYINNAITAAEAAAVIGLLNATLGFLLKVITFPFAVITAGLFLLIINAAMIRLASGMVGGFYVYGWWPAFWGAVVLSLLGMVIRAVMKDQ